MGSDTSDGFLRRMLIGLKRMKFYYPHTQIDYYHFPKKITRELIT